MARVTLSDLVKSGDLGEETVWFNWPNGKKYRAQIVPDKGGDSWVFEYRNPAKSLKLTVDNPTALICKVALAEGLENAKDIAYGRNWQCIFREKDGTPQSLKSIKDKYVAEKKKLGGIRSIVSTPSGLKLEVDSPVVTVEVIEKALSALNLNGDSVAVVSSSPRPLAAKKGFSTTNSAIFSNDKFKGTGFAYTVKRISEEDAHDDSSLEIEVLSCRLPSQLGDGLFHSKVHAQRI